jgi:hypothetical protein
MTEDADPSLICAVAEGADGRAQAFMPLCEYMRVRRKMMRYQSALNKIVALLDDLTGEEQRDVRAVTKPALLGDV